MPTTKKSSHKRKIPANLENNVYMYFKVQNKLGMSEYWCEIKPKLGERKCIFTLRQQTEKSFLFVLNILNFAHGTRIITLDIIFAAIIWFQVTLLQTIIHSGNYSWYK